MGDTREPRPPATPGPRQVAALAAKLVGYALDLCEPAGLGTAAMLLRGALTVLGGFTCDDCGQQKPPEAFPRVYTNGGGRQQPCFDCAHARAEQGGRSPFPSRGDRPKGPATGG